MSINEGGQAFVVRGAAMKGARYYFGPFVILAQSGLVRRTIANYILWNLCSYWALGPTYDDLSHKVYAEAGKLRRSFGRPPDHHP